MASPTWTVARTKDSYTNLQTPTLPLPHLAFKNVLLKPFGEFEILGGMSCLSPCRHELSVSCMFLR